MRSRIQLLVGAGLVGSLLGLNDHAMAQEGQASAALEEVIVTARRREEALMDTPLSITAFTGEDLALRQIERTNEIADATPNMVYRNVSTGSNLAAIVFIRGIGQLTPLPTVQPGVGTYVDGVYMSNIQGAVMDLVDVESIAVLRGPQGTLFGRNTVGGAIQMTTVKPREEFEGQVALEFGEFSYEQLRATLNVPFTDNFYGRFTALSRHEDGYIDTPLIAEDDGYPGDETTAFRAALRWLPSDALTIDWTADVSDRKDWGEPTVALEIFEEVGPAPENNFRGSNTWRYNNLVAPFRGTPLIGDQYAVSFGDYINYGTNFLHNNAEATATTLTVEWDISDSLTFKSISNYREQEIENAADGDQSPAPVTNQKGVFDGWQRTQEFQLLGNALDGRLNWLAGLYLFEEDMLNITTIQFADQGFISGAHVQNQSNAVFGQFTYDISDRLSLTLGARNTDEKFDSIVDDNIQYVTDLFCPPGSPIPVCPPGGGLVTFPPNTNLILPKGVFESDESRSDPYVNLAYQFTDTLMGYVSYAEGFKGGGFTQQVRPGNPVFAFAPEFAEVWEIGAKWTGWDNRLRLTGAVFTTDYKDMQLPANSTLGSIFVNAGNSEITGGELELAAAVTDRLTLLLGVGRLDAKYTSIRDVDILGNPAIVTLDINNLIPNTPDSQANASIMYRAPLAGGTLIARLDHTYEDSHFASVQNEPGNLVPSSSIFHGGLTYVHGSDRWEVALQGRNLTDEFHVINLGGGVSSGVRTALLAPPRQVHARFAYRF